MKIEYSNRITSVYNRNINKYEPLPLFSGTFLISVGTIQIKDQQIQQRHVFSPAPKRISVLFPPTKEHPYGNPTTYRLFALGVPKQKEDRRFWGPASRWKAITGTYLPVNVSFQPSAE